MSHSRYFSKAVVVAAAITLSACGVASEGGDMLNFKFWESGPFAKGDSAELGIAEMSKGNYIEAEALFRNALKTNPRDVHALLGAAILYHNTGQLVRAREMYEAVLAVRPPESEQFINLTDISTRPVSQVASLNLSLLESGATLDGMTSGAAGIGNQPPGAGMLGVAPSQSAPVMPSNTVLAPTVVFPGAPVAPVTMPSMAAPAPEITGFTGGDVSVISRFTTIRALRDQGMMTPDEYQARRQANIGALLPLSSPPPAAGLNRRVPSTEQVVARLKAIGRALELRAISVSQHSAERSMILDALMPSAPVVIANPGAPPQGLLEAADTVRRLEMLRDSGFISSDEYARERAAVEAAMLPPQPAAPAASSMMEAPTGLGTGMGAETGGDAAMIAGGPQPSVHLASYRSIKQAERGWSQLKRAHSEQLGELRHTVKKIDLGSKGVFYRLIAGPYNSKSSAADACRKLKSRRQFCEPAFVDFS